MQHIIPKSIIAKIWFVFISTILTFACFMIGAGLKPDWQSGKLSEYMYLMFYWESAIWFYPFIIYSALSMVLLVINSQYFVKKYWVRLGIYTGVILALQYSIIMLIFFGDEGWKTWHLYVITPLIIFLPHLFFFIIQLLLRYIKVIGTWIVFIITIILLLFISARGGYGGSFPGGIIFFALLAAPAWVLVIFSQTAWQLKTYSTTKPLFTPWFFWIMGWSAAWIIAINRAIEVYSKLPKDPPDCYIATVAANTNLVKTKVIPLKNGQVFSVTKQLQHFKLFEIILKTLLPDFHKILRSIYDNIGLKLSKQIKTQWLANFSYLLLKPLEWLVCMLIYCLSPDILKKAHEIYLDKRNKSNE